MNPNTGQRKFYRTIHKRFWTNDSIFDFMLSRLREMKPSNGSYSNNSSRFLWTLWLYFFLGLFLCDSCRANSPSNLGIADPPPGGALGVGQADGRPVGNYAGGQPSVQIPPISSGGQLVQQQKITDVSVMCASNAVNGQFVFNSPFSGKIYSARYANVHDCVYYNGYGDSTVAFSVPNYKCGTMIQRNAQNIISHIENEVYVQFDKETQNAEDKRFLFVCDRVSDASSALSSPYQPIPATYRGTIQPGQTIIVQTIEPTRVLATDVYTRFTGEPGSYGVTGSGGNTVQPYVWMEIQDGLGPGKSPVQRPLRLGDQVTLVVTGRSLSSGNQYDMFVHSCFASDGSGQNKIQLTDATGCTLKSTVAGKMSRQKNASEISYFVPIKAFKFPSSDDVYFSCAVEVCATCVFPELCPSGSPTASRHRRKASISSRSENSSESLQVHDYVRILDNADSQAFRRDTQSQSNLRNNAYDSGCFDKSVVIVLLIITAALLTALICVSVYAMYLLRQRKH